MPIQIGAETHDFSEPMGLLSDCHRRIEMFLRTLQRVSELIDRPLANEARNALNSALRYFQEAAPKHTADEEESLFPRLKEMNEPSVANAIAALEMLADDHRRAQALHTEVHALGVKCLDQGPLVTGEAERFRQAVSNLASIYREHIRIEDAIVFSAAKQALSGQQKSAIAREMASRRGVIRKLDI
jgi:hemerythrin-like domain-containing protein